MLSMRATCSLCLVRCVHPSSTTPSSLHVTACSHTHTLRDYKHTRPQACAWVTVSSHTHTFVSANTHDPRHVHGFAVGSSLPHLREQLHSRSGCGQCVRPIDHKQLYRVPNGRTRLVSCPPPTHTHTHAPPPPPIAPPRARLLGPRGHRSAR
jgi:hypothetical protein